MTKEAIRAAVTDEIALTCTLLGESAGEPIEGQIAVACVVRNRVLHPSVAWWGRGYRGVCLARQQFSCWWEANSNSAQVYALAEAMLSRQPLGGLVNELRWIAEGIIGDVIRDRTQYADHYLTTALWKSPHAPAWSKAKPVATIGHHTFFRLN